MKLFSIPNLFTLANLFCGLMSLYFLLTGINNDTLYIILGLLSSSLVFDFLDGFMARLLKSPSEIGKQLDSLADMVSFGAVPGFMMMWLLKISTSKLDPEHFFIGYLPFLGLLIPLFSALRLAKFNLDEEQTTYFKGLNTPANTILIFSLYWIGFNNPQIISTTLDLYFLIAITSLSCYLLIANIPMFSFKMKNLSWQSNHYKYIFLGISIFLLVLFKLNAVPFIVLLYIITSIIFRKKIIHA